eukprot:s8488_g2.t1
MVPRPRQFLLATGLRYYFLQFPSDAVTAAMIRAQILGELEDTTMAGTLAFFRYMLEQPYREDFYEAVYLYIADSMTADPRPITSIHPALFPLSAPAAVDATAHAGTCDLAGGMASSAVEPAANALYLHMCDFIAFLQGYGVPWTIENPSRSWLWKLPILEPLVEAHHMFHCETCAFGSQRLKRTAFLASHSEFQLVARLCPGCPVHLPWGITPQSDFATGREATFPLALCETICDAVELLCTARGSWAGELQEQEKSLKASMRPDVMRERPDADSEELRSMTEKEASEKKWLQGPFSPDEISSRFGRWLPVRRFGVRQNDKLRAIDDFRENQLNRAYSSVEKVVLHAMDHLLWSLQTLLRYLIDRGEVSLELSTGEVLRGQVHPSWSLRKDSLVVTALDLRSAYKQLPLSPLDQDKTVVVLRDHRSDTSKVDCYVMKTLPFGSSASVDKFLRVSAFIQAAGCELLLLWSNYFDDFPLASHHLTSTSSLAAAKAMLSELLLLWSNYFDDFPLASHHLTSTSSLAAAKAMLSLFGFEYAGDKLPPFRPWCEVLGIKLDLTAAHEGEVRISNKPSRVVEVQRLLDRALDSRSLTPAAVPSFVGKLQYADSQVWGRSGRIALGDLRSLGGSGSSAVNLDPDQMAALAVLRDRFAKGQPITLLASRPSLPGVLFTDGALEGGRASIGGVFYPSCRDMPAEVFGCPLPDAVLEGLKGDKEHVIGAVELYAVATAVTLWMPVWLGSEFLSSTTIGQRSIRL